MISRKKCSCEELYWISLRNIHVVALALIEIDDDFIETLDFPDLQDLHVFGGSERSIRHLTNMSPKYTGINFHGITESVGIRHVAENCPNLRHFTLADPKITNGVVDNLLFMFDQCTELLMVSLKDITFTDSECARLGPYGNLMYELVYVGAETESAFGAFIDECVDLSRLSYFCSGNDGVVLDRAAKTCTQLEVLLVDGVTTTNVIDLSQNCPELYNLQIYGFADDFATSSLEQLSRNLMLEILEFSDVSLSEEAVIAIGRLGSVTDLRCLECEMGTCAGFRSFRDSPISKSLTRFHLAIDGEIDINGGRNCVEGLAYCSNLDSLTFDGGPIDDASLILLCTSCPLLRYIDISIEIQHNKLSIDGLTRAIVECKHLKGIILTQSSTTDGVMSTNSTRVFDEFEEQLGGLRCRFPHVELNFTRP